MALVDFQVFQQQTHTTYMNVLAQEINLFNQATRNAIRMVGVANREGDFDESTWYRRPAGGFVRDRDPYADTPIGSAKLTEELKRTVRVGMGTYEIEYQNSDAFWRNRNPAEYMSIVGRAIAEDDLAKRLNNAIGIVANALVNQPEVTTDVTSNVSPASPLFTYENQVIARSKQGDAGGAQKYAAWIVHSKAFFDIQGANVKNQNALFSFGTVNVFSDPFGIPIIMTDSPQLVIPGSPDQYISLGLRPGAITVEANADFHSGMMQQTGRQQLMSHYQAEWTVNYDLTGFSWSEATGGKAPNSAGLLNAANWDRIAVSHKELPGVAVISL